MPRVWAMVGWLVLGAAGCGWYGSLDAPERGQPPDAFVTGELALSDDLSGEVLDLDTGIIEGYYNGPGECPSGITNTGWDLKLGPGGRLLLNSDQRLSIGAVPGARPDTVDPGAVVFGPSIDRAFEGDLLLLVRTDLDALYALFDPQPLEHTRALAFSFQRLDRGVCAPICSPVHRELPSAGGLRLDLDEAWIVRTDVALCGVPLDTGEHAFVFDLSYAQGQWAPEQGQIRGPGQAPGSLLVRAAEGRQFELRYSADDLGQLEWVEVQLAP